MGNGNEEMRKWNYGNESHMNGLAWVRACLVRKGVFSSLLQLVYSGTSDKVYSNKRHNKKPLHT